MTTTTNGSAAGLSGLAHCGSVWVCPVCAAKIATRRAEELADVQRFALEQGCSATMVTLTMRHHQGQSLADCWAALSKGWHGVTSGKQWMADTDRGGLVGWVKAVEVTQGKNGWHVHVHALLIWQDLIDQKDADDIGERMWQRWTRALRRNGFDSLKDSGGLDVRTATLDPDAGTGLHEYFVKLAHEITGGQAKLAKGGGRTPFQLLSDAVEGLADEVKLWHEWERASKGRRQMEWSRGRRDLRKWAGLGRELTDEEIAEEEPGGSELVLLMPESWCELRHLPDRVCELLEATEGGGFAAATSLLDAWGLAWQPSKGAPPWPARPPGSARLDVIQGEGLQHVAATVINRHRFFTL